LHQLNTSLPGTAQNIHSYIAAHTLALADTPDGGFAQQRLFPALVNIVRAKTLVDFNKPRRRCPYNDVL
jgi:hypothetical protein